MRSVIQKVFSIVGIDNEIVYSECTKKVQKFSSYRSLRRFKPKLVTNCKKQYLYKPKDFYNSVRDEIYMHRTLGTDENFKTSRLTKNVRKKLFSYFNPTCAKFAKIAYMHIFQKTNRPKLLSASSKSNPKVGSGSWE